MSLTFLNAVLWPLLALLSVPVLLHLFARSRPPAYKFSSIELVQRVIRSTMRIKKPQAWILLILRMLFRRAMKGQLPLIQAMKQAASDLLKPSGLRQVPQEGMDMLAYLVENAKKIALLAAGAAYQAHPDDLDNQQEILGMISDIIIEIFAMDSGLLRVKKMKMKSGDEGVEISDAIIHVYIVDAMMRIERWAKLIFAAISSGDTLRTQLSALKRLTRYTPVNSVALRRKIADRIIKIGRYVVQ